jgi:hypothetical protein
MKHIIIIVFVLSTVIPMELFGQAVIRGENERARSNSAENLRKILNIDYNAWDFGLTLGTAHSLADIGGTGINSRFSFFDTQPRAIGFQAGGYVRHHFSELISFKAGINYARVGAADSLSPANSGRFPRGFHYRNNLLEISLESEIYLPKEYLNIPPDLYFFTGFLLLFHNPQLRNAAGAIIPSEVRTPQPVIPFGIGVHYTTPQNFRFGFRVGLRKTFFDTLDGHAAPQGTRNDAYFFNSFSVGYFFVPRGIR